MDDNSLTVIEPKKTLDEIKALVTNGLDSKHSRTAYGHAIEDFLAWRRDQGNPPLIKATVNAYKYHLQSSTDYAPSTINLRLSAVRGLAKEAADNGVITDALANGISNVTGIKKGGVRSGNWLTLEQAQRLINTPDKTRLKGLRDRAILAVMIGGGLRRSEVAGLQFSHIQQRDGRWVIIDLIGKRNYMRTVPLPNWAKAAIDDWTLAANLHEGHIFRHVNKAERLQGNGLTPQAIQNIVKQYAEICGYELAAHDLRRTFAKLARNAKAPIDQIQLTLGHKSVQTTELYLGTKQDLTNAPCDYIKIDLD